jgi:hypothetical protein
VEDRRISNEDLLSFVNSTFKNQADDLLNVRERLFQRYIHLIKVSQNGNRRSVKKIHFKELQEALRRVDFIISYLKLE